MDCLFRTALLLAYLGLIQGQFNLLAKVDHPPLSLTSCSASFAGKETISAIKSSQTRIAQLKRNLENIPILDSTKPLFTYLDWGINSSEKPSWLQGCWPFVVRGKVSNFLSTCYELGGAPPTAPPGEYEVLNVLLKKIGVTSQIVSLDICSADLCYQNGVTALRLEKSLINTDGTAKTEATEVLLRYKTSISALEPSSSSFISYSPSEFNDVKNQLCILPKRSKMTYLTNKYSFNSRSISISKNLDVLHSVLDNYLDQVKLTTLDLSQDTSENPLVGYPSFIRQLVEFLENFESCYESERCTLMENDVSEGIESLIRLLSATTARIGLGFLELYDATCEISNSARLRCTCPNSDEKFVKNLILPFFQNGKKLIFDNFIHRVFDQSGQGKITESCFYEESNVLYMLTLECCEKLMVGSDESVSFCPHTLISNYPSMVLDKQMLIVKGIQLQDFQTKCEATTVNQPWPGDLLKLTSCDISAVDKVGTYHLKGSGLLDVQVRLRQILTAEVPLAHRDLIFYSAVGISGFLVLLLMFFMLLFCSPRMREIFLSCWCKNCKEKPHYMEPLGNRSLDGAREYELSALHIRPFVSSMK